MYKHPRLQSPTGSKQSTINYSLLNSIDTSTPCLTPSKKPYSFLFQDQQKNIKKNETLEDETKIINDLIQTKIQFALFEEFIIVRDHEIKFILEQIKNVSVELFNSDSAKEYFENLIEIMNKKLKINEVYN